MTPNSPHLLCKMRGPAFRRVEDRHRGEDVPAGGDGRRWSLVARHALPPGDPRRRRQLLVLVEVGVGRGRLRDGLAGKRQRPLRRRLASGERGRRRVQREVVVVRLARRVGGLVAGRGARLHPADARQSECIALARLRVLADHVAAQAVLAPALAPVCPRGADRPPPLADARAEAAQHPRERELGRQDEGHEESGRDDDERARAAEVPDERPGDELADSAAGAHGLALEGDGAEGQRQEPREGEQEPRVADRLRVRGVDRPAPEELPADEAEDEGEQQSGEAEQLRDEELGEERAEGADEVAGRSAGARPEEGGRVAGVERGERDEEHQGDGEGHEPQQLGPAPGLAIGAHG
jgi:hypothetical protein